MFNAFEIPILGMIFIQIMYKCISTYLIKKNEKKEKTFESPVKKIIRVLEENDRKNKETINTLEELIKESINNNIKTFKKIEVLEENDKKNNELIGTLENVIYGKIKILERNINHEIKIINNEFERIMNEYFLENDKIVNERILSLEALLTETIVKNTKSFEKIKTFEEIDRKNIEIIETSLGTLIEYEVERIWDHIDINKNQNEIIEFPSGMIISWIPPQYINTDNDEKNRIRPRPPAGWAYCDGTNGTPDLRCKSLVGMGYEDEKMMINMREEIYNPLIQEEIERSKITGDTLKLSRLQTEPPFKNYPVVMHNNLANNNINYIVGFSYNGCKRVEYNDTRSAFSQGDIICSPYSNNIQSRYDTDSPVMQVWLKNMNTDKPEKMIYKPEKTIYNLISPTSIAHGCNATRKLYEKINLPLENTNVRTAVYYLIKL